jgi:hypothetical protein
MASVWCSAFGFAIASERSIFAMATATWRPLQLVVTRCSCEAAVHCKGTLRDDGAVFLDTKEDDEGKPMQLVAGRGAFVHCPALSALVVM